MLGAEAFLSIEREWPEGGIHTSKPPARTGQHAHAFVRAGQEGSPADRRTRDMERASASRGEHSFLIELFQRLNQLGLIRFDGQVACVDHAA